jgi:hypothetical protein
MTSRLPRLVVDYNEGVVGDGVGWLRLGAKLGDRRVTQVFYQEQLDDEDFELAEGLKILMRDIDGDIPDVVGTIHQTENGEWASASIPTTSGSNERRGRVAGEQA